MIGTSPRPNSAQGGSANIASEVAWLYVIQGATAIVPLVLLHHISRTIGPAAWGTLAVAEAIGRYLQVVVEYGLQVSGARDAAIARADSTRRGVLITNIIASQAVLSLISAPLAILAASHLGLGRESTYLTLSAIIWGVSQAMTLSWYYQAIQRIRLFAMIDFCSRALAVSLICTVVHSPRDAWRVLGIQAASSLGCLALSGVLALRDTSPIAPSLAGTWKTLKEGFSLFWFRAAATLYISLNVVLLSLFAAPAEVGAFAAAERIARLTLYGLHPLSQVFYVRISHLEVTDTQRASMLALKATAILSACGLFCGGVLFVGGPAIAQSLLGKAFEESGTLIRLFGIVISIATINSALGAAWLLPKRQDSVLSIGSIAAGLVNLLVIALFARYHGALGMMASLIMAELTICILYYSRLLHLNIHPFTLLMRRNDQVVPAPTI